MDGTPPATRIGFVGLGTMGRPMAERVLAAGYALTCASRSPGPVRELAAAGATAAADAREVAAASDTIVLCLPDGAAVREVVGHALPSLAGRTVVDCSTIAPDETRRLHERVVAAGGDYLDAPVSGGPAGAAAGSLSVMVGGRDDVLERARPVLDSFAGEIVFVGGPGAGQVAKLCNQVVVSAQMLGLCEAIVLAERAGIDPSKLHRVIVHSTGDCTMARTRFPVAGVVPSSPASNGWRPDFTTRLMLKDLELALSYGAEQAAPLASAGVTKELLAATVDDGHADSDWSALVDVLRRRRASAPA